MNINDVIEYAKQCGYDSAKYDRTWNNYQVYQPIYNNSCFTGVPYIILEQDGKCRMSTIQEAYDYLNYVNPIDSREAEELKKIMEEMNQI